MNQRTLICHSQGPYAETEEWRIFSNVTISIPNTEMLKFIPILVYKYRSITYKSTDSSVRIVREVGLQPLTCWDCEYEFRQGHGSLSVISVVWYQLEVSASGWSLVQGSPTECGVSERDRETLIMWRLGNEHSCHDTGGNNNSALAMP